MAGSDHVSPTATERHEEVMPSLEELRQERLDLLQQIRRHKDAQDSLALDIENEPGSADVYRTAARVHHCEQFAHRAADYGEELLPDEIACVVTADEINSEKKIAMYIKELQKKRDAILKKVSEIQDSLDKKSDPAQWYKDAVANKYEANDEYESRAVEQTLLNENDAETLVALNSFLRNDVSNASAKLSKINRDAEANELFLTNSIQKTKLANTTRARQCRELNVANGTATNGLQALMSQMNAEHYGHGGAPTTRQLPQRMKEAIEDADQDNLFIEAKDVTKEDVEKVQGQKKGKKDKKEKKEKSSKASKKAAESGSESEEEN